MEFNQLVLEKIFPLLKEKGFQVIEQYKNFIRFSSDSVEATISYNELDKLSLFEVGKKNSSLYPINNNVIKNVFNSIVQLNQVTKEAFVNNVEHFLSNEGKVLLEGDINKIKEVEYYIQNESKAYTSKLLSEQNVKAADIAWANGRYKEFIKLIDKMDKGCVPSSYQIKYDMAKKRL